MDPAEPGLFDLPDPERSASPERPLRVRNRETWARTTTAEVTVVEPGDSDVGPASDAFDALGWLIWPTEGMEGLLEAGAFRILSVDSGSWPSVDRGTVSWTVTVKLTNVDELRRLAAEAHPDEAGLVVDSLAVAWRLAADPFAPLRSIPGTAWRPGQVDVEHLPAKAVGNR